MLIICEQFRAVLAFVLSLAACTSAAEKQAKAEVGRARRDRRRIDDCRRRGVAPLERQSGMSRISSSASCASGLAPQSLHDQKGEDYWKVPVHAYQIGPSVLYAYIYTDSLARRAVTSTLDTLMAAPAGKIGLPDASHPDLAEQSCRCDGRRE